MSVRSELREARADLTAATANISHLQEALVDLELALEDKGWSKLDQWGEQEFSREGLQKSARLCRVMAVANPLIKRGLGIRQGYVFGGGYEVRSRDEDVNAVVQALLDDAGNRRSVFGPQACEENERALGTDGNLAIVAFSSPLTGKVQVRTVAFGEIKDVISNPNDKDDPWFYLREWTETDLSADGQTVTHERRMYHPALTFRPMQRPRQINDVAVDWDAPLHLIKVNALDGWKFGIGDAYAALPWARLYRDFLGDWAKLVKALSQFAFKVSSSNPSKADALRQKIAAATATAPAGSTAVMDTSTVMEAIPKTGATVDSESGKPLASMVASALGVPVTMLLGDPGQTGARAVAETLDRPTINEMNGRRAVWTETFLALAEFAVRQSIRAPRGELQGTITRDPWSKQEIIVLAGGDELGLEVTWPSLEDQDVAALVKSIVEADATGKLPPLTIIKLLLDALDVPDVDDILTSVTDANGEWLDPYESVATAVGNAAVAAARSGQSLDQRVAAAQQEALG
jgi:hypothetical protein